MGWLPPGGRIACPSLSTSIWVWEADARAWAEHYGVPFQEPKAFRTDPALMALACLAAGRLDALVACCRLLHRMVFVDGMVIDDAAIASIPDTLGLDADRFLQSLADPATAASHEALLDEAHGRGAFGVPTFFLGDRMF
ncbi:DsbA family protein [Emcibacter sp. SYSU 3D8]|uniref:DsbA family protein n=1 Tax=Emcibacter sp. SYSU 3D8 TaxID=3133969 RepID=UPI0031FEC5BA